MSAPGLDLDRVREMFESSTDFTIGLEEEFAIVDPATLELQHRFEDLYAACQEGRAAGGLRRRRADRLGDRDPLGARRELRRGDLAAARAARAAVRARRRDGARAGGHRHPPVGRLPRPADHRYTALPPPAGGPRLGGAAQQHLEHARPRRHPRGGPCRSRSATGCGSCCRCCWPSPPTRPSSTAATPASTRCAARSSPAPSRAAASRARSSPGTATRASSICWFARAPSSSRPSSGGACGRTTCSGRSRCGSVTPRAAARSPSPSPA